MFPLEISSIFLKIINIVYWKINMRTVFIIKKIIILINGIKYLINNKKMCKAIKNYL